jgi:hypothetical protein
MATLIPRGFLDVPQKPTRPTQTAKNDTGQYAAFENLLRRVVSVPHSEIKAKLDAEKAAKKKLKRANS